MNEFKSNYEGWPTTRCYPRTLEEAFPKDPSNAEWLIRPQKKRTHIENFFLAAAFWIWLGLAYWWSNT
jgi:hypothetical protein